MLWGKNDAIPIIGRFLLVGVATWSGYDMKLLDVLEQTPGDVDEIGVFDTAECQSDEDFEARIPGIGPVFQVPVVGLWHDGKLVAHGSGYRGCEVIAFHVYRIDPSGLSKMLDPQVSCV